MVEVLPPDKVCSLIFGEILERLFVYTSLSSCIWNFQSHHRVHVHGQVQLLRFSIPNRGVVVVISFCNAQCPTSFYRQVLRHASGWCHIVFAQNKHCDNNEQVTRCQV